MSRVKNSTTSSICFNKRGEVVDQMRRELDVPVQAYRATAIGRGRDEEDAVKMSDR
jgi:hypothetical protein